MKLRSMLSVALLATSALAVGCSSADEDSSSSSSKVMLTGSVGGSAGGAKAKSYGAISNAGGSLHVTAHEVHVRGAEGQNVEVPVAADGTFNIGVERGHRWLVTVDDAQGQSSILTFGSGYNILDVRANGSASRVDVGGLSIVGGEARSALALDGKLGIEAALAGLDDVFETANGAVIEARKAVEEAQRAAEEALKVADNALDAAEEARKAAEAAARAAGR